MPVSETAPRPRSQLHWSLAAHLHGGDSTPSRAGETCGATHREADITPALQSCERSR